MCKNLLVNLNPFLILFSVDDIFQESSRANALEKKQRNFDITLSEWKTRVDELNAELEMSQREARSYSTELFKIKNTYEEVVETVEIVRRENKSLQSKKTDNTNVVYSVFQFLYRFYFWISQ